MPAILTESLFKDYGMAHAVRDLNLAIDNEIYGLLGPNGSGKTTTVSMLTTLLAPTSGRALIEGHDVIAEKQAVRECISYVPQHMAVDPRLTGWENVDLFARLYGLRDRSERKKRVDEALATMSLTDRADDQVKTYSGGMYRRTELAQALVHDPQVLILDEPTVGLDVTSRRSVWEHIVKLRRNGMTVLVTTHQMDEAERYCTRVGVLRKGVLLREGAPQTLTAALHQIIMIRTEDGVPSKIPDGVHFVQFENGEALFTAEDGTAALPQLTAAYEADGKHIISTVVREPNLEDVYLMSIGNVNADDGMFDKNSFRHVMDRSR
ncbi:MAG: ABC transporter ATP-binding protein [Candidatus Methanomethylophilus sp.]|nr:ABC transporter ATP-binding protein [Methanomethylophilus sp.]MDD4222143.1 ABC transporter ATP-binding protein [Methanomethylophilus sp.]